MVREQLKRASELLASAASQTDDSSDRLADLADQLENLSEGGRGPDHGRLARFQAALDEIQPDVDDDTAATIEEARDELSDYRETLEGV
jgi:ABC-type transporter Mla subunit MlaD